MDAGIRIERVLSLLPHTVIWPPSLRAWGWLHFKLQSSETRRPAT